MTNHHDASPLLWDTTDAPSAFTPDDWFSYCEKLTGRTRPTLPALAVHSVIAEHMDLVIDRYDVRADDFTQADHPFAIFEHQDRPIVLGTSAKGSYAAGGLDELIALGARHIVCLGGAGALVDTIDVDDLVVAPRALRDEGVSLHYMPPSRYADGSTSLTSALVEATTLSSRAVHVGPVWTTTAHFRQTLPRLEAFRDEGCIAVNNEAAPAFAVGWRRHADVAVLLRIGDSLSDGRFRVSDKRDPAEDAATASDLLDIALEALVRFDRGT